MTSVKITPPKNLASCNATIKVGPLICEKDNTRPSNSLINTLFIFSKTQQKDTFLKTDLYEWTLVETAGTFYMLQGNFW